MEIIDISKISVIIPYNRDRGWLQDAVNSVPDGVELILSKSDGGASKNFNAGIHKSSGQFIKYLCDDDILTPNCLHDSVAGLIDLSADFIHGNAYNFTTKKINEFRPQVHVPNLTQMLQKNRIHGGTLMYRRSIFDTIGFFNESLIMGEEYEFNLRCLKHGLKLGYVDKFLIYYRKHGQQKTKYQDKKKRNEQVVKIKAMYRE